MILEIKLSVKDQERESNKRTEVLSPLTWTRRKMRKMRKRKKRTENQNVSDMLIT